NPIIGLLHNEHSSLIEPIAVCKKTRDLMPSMQQLADLRNLIFNIVSPPNIGPPCFGCIAPQLAQPGPQSGIGMNTRELEFLPEGDEGCKGSPLAASKLIGNGFNAFQCRLYRLFPRSFQSTR